MSNAPRKLNAEELSAYWFLQKSGPFCPGTKLSPERLAVLMPVLKSLVRKSAAVVEMSDDGPVFTAVPHG